MSNEVAEVVATQPQDVIASQEAATISAVKPPAEGVPNAQDTEASAPPAQPGEVAPETPEQAERRRQRSFGRKLDKAIRRAAEAEARAQLLEKQLKDTAPAPQDSGAPRLEDFTDIQDYAKAIEKHASEKAVKEIDAKRAADSQREHQQRLKSEWEKRVSAAEGKYEDFDEVVGDLKPNAPWSFAVMEAENGPDIAYYLGTHLDEVKAIASLSPTAQIRAIGRLEAKLAAEPAKPKTPSKAPAPITPVGGKSGGANDAPQDTDDIKTWMKKEETRVRKLAL